MIKLRFEKGSLSTQVMLKDEALPALLDIVSKHQSDDAAPPKAASRAELESEIITDLDNPSKYGERINFVCDWMRHQTPSEALSNIGWSSFPEKILILGALIEAKSTMRIKGDVSWRNADIESIFTSARVPAPANFARDIANAIRGGIIAPVTPRTYRVSRTGWLRLYERLIAIKITPNKEEADRLSPGAFGFSDLSSSQSFPEG